VAGTLLPSLRGHRYTTSTDVTQRRHSREVGAPRLAVVDPGIGRVLPPSPPFESSVESRDGSGSELDELLQARLDRTEHDLAAVEIELAAREGRLVKQQATLDQPRRAHQEQLEALVGLDASVEQARRLAAELAGRDERISDLQLLLEAAYRQRDESDARLESLQNQTDKSHRQSAGAKKQMAATAIVSCIVARSSRDRESPAMECGERSPSNTRSASLRAQSKPRGWRLVLAF
jgi:hypothetical protein